MMSFEKTKISLIKALKLKNTHVLTLHGPWGTGKTHLWREIKAELEERKEASTTYLSCMTYNSISLLKSATMTALLSQSTGIARYGEKAGKLVVGLLNTKLPKEMQITVGFSDIQPLLPLIKKSIPSPSLVVFDDIERATDLDVGDLLGFVNFLVEELDQQVLLIMNREKLSEKAGERWQQIREKVVSLEIELLASSDEYVAIGLGDINNDHFNLFKEKIELLKIKNIRAIQHMRRVYDAVSAEEIFTPSQWMELIPSIVIFVAIHTNSIPDAAEVKRTIHKGAFFDPDEEQTEEQARAHALVQNYKLGTVDSFETEILLPYLQSGHLNVATAQSYAKHMDMRAKRNGAESTAHENLMKFYWDPNIQKAQLEALITATKPHLDFLSAGTATKLANAANEAGNTKLAQEIIYDWISKNEAAIKSAAENPSYLDERDDFIELHDNIKSVIEFRHTTIHKALSVPEAIHSITSSNTTGSRQLAPFKTTTPSSIEHILRSADHVAFREIFRFFARRLNGRSSDQHFGTASNHFIEACQNIIKLDSEGRLTELIRRLAKASNVASQIGIS
ncbi:hypothetical protein JYJ95_16195 [Corallococcus exiguus]|uniref:P-loop NTPase fold protein n=1 Tax=Corallococcus exiguus TaxID=83462 RepID=UPI001A8E05E7|nr:P-loop NTPase fold protein [Corallococcus exiguus]MBN8468062.1 hypothetical protein [Corallococcus exiguus]